MTPRHSQLPQPRPLDDYRYRRRNYASGFWGAVGVAVGASIVAGAVKLLCRVFCE